MDRVFELKSPNYEAIKANAASAYSAGDLATEEDCYVFPLVDVGSGADYVGVIKAEKVSAEKAVGAITAGEALYHHNTNHNVSNVATSAVFVGFAGEDALSADTHVIMSFDGRAAFFKA